MIDQTVIQELMGIVGEDNVLHNKADLQTYEYDAYLEKSLPDVVVFVKSAQEVAAVVKLANRQDLSLIHI